MTGKKKLPKKMPVLIKLSKSQLFKALSNSTNHLFTFFTSLKNVKFKSEIKAKIRDSKDST